jgi:C_GCAxxG_C_C family probable redox protein
LDARAAPRPGPPAICWNIVEQSGNILEHKGGNTMNRGKEAVAIHEKGCNCAQAVLLSFARELSLDEETAARIATGFGGGMGRLGATCGAATGAFMVLGMARGMRRAEDQAEKEAVYALVRDFAGKFAARHGTLLCRDLLGVDLGTEEGRASARERGLFDTRCTAYISDAVDILEQMLVLRK